MRERLEDHLEEVPEDFRQGPVAFAAAALIGPFIIVLLSLAVGPSASSPLYTVAAIVFVASVSGFAWTTYRRLKSQRAEDARREAERARRRTARRRSAARVAQSRPVSRSAQPDQRRAS